MCLLHSHTPFARLPNNLSISKGMGSLCARSNPSNMLDSAPFRLASSGSIPSLGKACGSSLLWWAYIRRILDDWHIFLINDFSMFRVIIFHSTEKPFFYTQKVLSGRSHTSCDTSLVLTAGTILVHVKLGTPWLSV